MAKPYTGLRRKQVVNVEGSTPYSKDLKCGVPQGTVLGPILYTYLLCTSQLGDIVRTHGLAYHFYVDDSQLYCSFKFQDKAISVRAIESCLNDIDVWLVANILQLNKGKKEENRTSSYWGYCVAGEYIKVSSSDRNIGVTFDSHINFENHAVNTCKTAFFHLRNIAK